MVFVDPEIHTQELDRVFGECWLYVGYETSLPNAGSYLVNYMGAEDLQREIERWLYHEALLLDEQRFDEWLELFADDIRYCMPTSEAVQGVDEADQLHVAYLDEDRHMLGLRVKQLNTGLRHVEVPPSLTCRLITNLLADSEDDRADSATARSNFLIYQMRHGRHESQFAGRRKDRLRKIDGSWKLAERYIYVTQPVLQRAISIFF